MYIRIRVYMLYKGTRCVGVINARWCERGIGWIVSDGRIGFFFSCTVYIGARDLSGVRRGMLFWNMADGMLFGGELADAGW